MGMRALPRVCAVSLAAEFLARGLSVRFSATGGSMRPTIVGGEVITVAPISPAALTSGAIILFRQGARVVAHRVVRVVRTRAGLRFLTRGDAAMHVDPPVDADAVLGRVVAVERKGCEIDLTGAGSVWSGRLARCISTMRVVARCGLGLSRVKA